MPRRPDPTQALYGLFFVAFFAVPAVLAWGDPAAFFAHPARAACIAVAAATMLATAFTGCSGLRPGRRSTPAHRRTVPAIFLIMLLLAWLPPYADRRDLWTLDGDAMRWTGVLVYGVGAALRVLPMFVLGGRFSTVLAIQEGHRLETGGPYAVVRHPSYLGGCLMLLGWALLFRSGTGLLLMVPFVLAIAYRIRVEEASLAAEFGEEYERYRRRTWRLVPFVY